VAQQGPRRGCRRAAPASHAAPEKAQKRSQADARGNEHELLWRISRVPRRRLQHKPAASAHLQLDALSAVLAVDPSRHGHDGRGPARIYTLSRSLALYRKLDGGQALRRRDEGIAPDADAAKRLALPSRLNLGLAQRHVCPLPRPEIEAGARLRNLLGP